MDVRIIAKVVDELNNDQKVMNFSAFLRCDGLLLRVELVENGSYYDYIVDYLLLEYSIIDKEELLRAQFRRMYNDLMGH